MYYINKIIGFLISPIGIAIAGLVIAVVCARLKKVDFVKWIGSLTVIWLWLWMTPVMTRFVGASLEREFLVDGRVPAVESFPNADAIVLHGGSMGVDTNFSGYAEMWTSADRVWQAARLWKAGKAPRIIATGDGARESTLGLLKELGVDEKCVEFLDARNTEEEAKGVGRCLNHGIHGIRGKGVDSLELEGLGVRGQELGIMGQSVKPKVLVVTSAWHMKRTRMMFEKYAKELEVVCAPADFECSFRAASRFDIRELLPDDNAFMLNSFAFHEWVGIVGYGVMR